LKRGALVSYIFRCEAEDLSGALRMFGSIDHEVVQSPGSAYYRWRQLLWLGMLFNYPLCQKTGPNLSGMHPDGIFNPLDKVLLG
jgi:hypothetical protein